MKSRFLFLAVGALLAAACGPLTAPAHAQQARPASTVSVAHVGAPVRRVAAVTPASYAAAATQAVNKQRSRHARHVLRQRSCLIRQAQARATAMARSGRLAHAALTPVQSACGMRRVGENIAYGFASGRDVVRNGWMLSTLHRRNLLSRHYRGVGVAAAQGPNGQWYVAMVLGAR